MTKSAIFLLNTPSYMFDRILNNMVFPPCCFLTKQQFSCYNPIKTSVLSLHTGHANFDFNLYSVFTQSQF